MSRASSSHSLQVFPFLAVLVCAMGALIMLLLVTARRMHKVAEAKAIAREIAEEAAEALHAPPSPRKPLAAELEAQKAARDTRRLQREERRAAIASAKQRQEEREEGWRKQLAEAGIARDQQRQSLAAVQTELDGLRQKLQVTETNLHKLGEKKSKIKTLAQHDARTLSEAEREHQKLSDAIETAQRKMADLKRSNSEAASRFAFIPYDGVSGTTRRPIYIECTGTGIRFQPENELLSAEDLTGFTETYNPLLLASRKLIEHWQSHAAENGRETPPGRPYILLVVRPTGTVTYYVARKMLSQLGDDFGYELVEADFTLQLPPAVPEAKVVIQKAVAEALKNRGQMLAVGGRIGESRLGVAAPGADEEVIEFDSLDEAVEAAKNREESPFAKNSTMMGRNFSVTRSPANGLEVSSGSSKKLRDSRRRLEGGSGNLKDVRDQSSAREPEIPRSIAEMTQRRGGGGTGTGSRSASRPEIPGRLTASDGQAGAGAQTGTNARAVPRGQGLPGTGRRGSGFGTGSGVGGAGSGGGTNPGSAGLAGTGTGSRTASRTTAGSGALTDPLLSGIADNSGGSGRGQGMGAGPGAAFGTGSGLATGTAGGTDLGAEFGEDVGSSIAAGSGTPGEAGLGGGFGSAGGASGPGAVAGTAAADGSGTGTGGGTAAILPSHQTGGVRDDSKSYALSDPFASDRATPRGGENESNAAGSPDGTATGTGAGVGDTSGGNSNFPSGRTGQRGASRSSQAGKIIDITPDAIPISETEVEGHTRTYMTTRTTTRGNGPGTGIFDGSGDSSEKGVADADSDSSLAVNSNSTQGGASSDPQSNAPRAGASAGRGVRAPSGTKAYAQQDDTVPSRTFSKPSTDPEPTTASTANANNAGSGSQSKASAGRQQGRGRGRSASASDPKQRVYGSNPEAQRDLAAIPASSSSAKAPKQDYARQRWGGSNTGQIGFERQIPMQVFADKIIIGKNDIEIVIESGTTQKELVESVLQALDAQSQSWGRPPPRFYWVPYLKFEVQPGGGTNYEQLHVALRDWGIFSESNYQTDGQSGKSTGTKSSTPNGPVKSPPAKSATGKTGPAVVKVQPAGPQAANPVGPPESPETDRPSTTNSGQRGWFRRLFDNPFRY